MPSRIEGGSNGIGAGGESPLRSVVENEIGEMDVKSDVKRDAMGGGLWEGAVWKKMAHFGGGVKCSKSGN
jgi:hypothetical protein